MAVIFPKSSDIILKVAGIVVGIGALIGVAWRWCTLKVKEDDMMPSVSFVLATA